MHQLLKELEKNQTNYKSVPLWAWNDELDEDQLLEQIKWMKQAGIGGFFIHARSGLKTEYMSAEWMRCVDICVEEAKKQGMQAWIYDENGWPSGFAGGKLLKNSENRDIYLTHSVGEYDLSAWLVYSLETEKLCRVTKPISGNCLNVYLHVSPCTVDILNSSVVEQFLDETHEKYAQRYGENFSKVIAGFFTDEPQYYRWETAYTRKMPEIFKEYYGEDLLEGLGLLFVEKEGYRTFRYRYWYLMQKLMLQNYAEKVYEWCEKHDVKFTGHYIEETSLGFQVCCCGGVMPFYEFMHMPGIDWLGRNVGNEMSLRQVNSVAQQLGKKQVLSETYSCCGWNITPKELKVIGDFQYVGGINRTCQHMVHYSEHGQRKRDFPAHYSKINTWTNFYFKDFNDYFTRLGYLLSNSKEIVNVAMLHPIRSAYLEYKDDGEQGRKTIGDLENIFSAQQERLSQDQIPFHFLDETLMERYGFVNGNKIGCGLCEYEYLIIPTCYTMGRHTEELIRQYVMNGGKILLLDKKPSYLEGKEYEYFYLNSNVTYQELLGELPYQLKESVPQVHSTFRESEEGSFLFVQNYGQESKIVSYQLSDGYTSFVKWDLTTMSSMVISTEFTLEAGESCVLMFSTKIPETEISKEIVHLSDVAEVVDTTENYLALDTIRYSKDGLSYSEELSCMGVFQQLLKEQYEGPLFLKYVFQVEKIPSQITLIAEKYDNNSLEVNGKTVLFNKTWERDHQFLRGDILPFITQGKNEVIRKMHFHQSQETYYALFGEGITESLINSLSYDSEIEPIYLAGEFGVYAGELEKGKKKDIWVGTNFYIDKVPYQVENLVKDGYPFFAGIMTLKQKIVLHQTNVILEFKGRFQGMTIWVNGNKAGSLLFENQIDISDFAKCGTNEIVIELIVGNRNLLGPHHWLQDEEPELVTPYVFEMTNMWESGRSSQYRDEYAFVEVPVC